MQAGRVSQMTNKLILWHEGMQTEFKAVTLGVVYGYIYHHPSLLDTLISPLFIGILCGYKITNLGATVLY